MDRIEFYSDKEINNWYQEFQKEKNTDKVALPSIPFGWYTIIRELLRRENIKSLLDDFKSENL